MRLTIPLLAVTALTLFGAGETLAGEKPRLRVEGIAIKGRASNPSDAMALAAAITENRPTIDACSGAALAANPGLHGKVVVAFTVSTAGSVSDARVKRSTLENPEIETCVVAAFWKITFPKPTTGAPIEAVYPVQVGEEP